MSRPISSLHSRLRRRLGCERGISTIEWIGLTAVVLVLLSGIIVYVQVQGGQVGAAAGSSMDGQIALWEAGGGSVSPYGEGEPAQGSGPDAVPYGAGSPAKMGDLFEGALGRFGDLIRGLPARLTDLLGPREAVSAEDIERMLADQLGLSGIDLSDGDKSWSGHELRMLRDVLQLLPTELYKEFGGELTGLVRRHECGPSSDLCIPLGIGGAHQGTYVPWDKDLASPEDYGKVLLYDGWDKPVLVHEMIHLLTSTHKTNEDGTSDAFYSQLCDDYAAQFNYVYDEATRQWQYNGNKGDLPSPYARKALDPAEDMAEAARLYVFEPEKLRGPSATEEQSRRYDFLKTHVFYGKEY